MRTFSSVVDASMWLFSKAEQLNRGTTMLAAFRLANKHGMRGQLRAIEIGKEASDTAHAVYGRATRPLYAMGKNVFARGAGLFYMYAKFGHNYMQLCYDLGFRKHNLKAFAWAVLSPIVIGGAAAVPFKDEIFWLFGKILRILGIRRDPEKWVWDIARKHIGEKGESLARHGISGAMGVDISSSLSIGVGAPHGLIDLIGAPGSVAKGIYQAGKYAGQGQYLRATEKVLPRGAENILRAYREKDTGLVTGRGARVWDESLGPYKPSATETAARATGFRSTKQAVLAEKAWESKREEKAYNDRRTNIYEQYKAYKVKPRPDKLKALRKEILEFNRDVQKYRVNTSLITMQSLKRIDTRMSKPTKRERLRLQ
jgi:hypothetical protein